MKKVEVIFVIGGILIAIGVGIQIGMQFSENSQIKEAIYNWCDEDIDNFNFCKNACTQFELAKCYDPISEQFTCIPENF